MASQGVSIAVQLTSTVVLARLLSPDDFGVIAMVLAIINFGTFRSCNSDG
jgi:PST family polysaccharide transporter